MITMRSKIRNEWKLAVWKMGGKVRCGANPRFLQGRRETVERVPGIDVRHMYHSAEGVEASLDLVAIARIPV